jgi:hypothetical protein
MMLDCFFGFGFGFGCTPMDRDERYDTMRHDFRREEVHTHAHSGAMSVLLFSYLGNGERKY